MSLRRSRRGREDIWWEVFGFHCQKALMTKSIITRTIHHSSSIHDFRPPPEGIKIPIGNDPFDCFLAPSSLDISEDDSASEDDSSDSDQFINIIATDDNDCFNSEDT
jgi:hypothetical protein